MTDETGPSADGATLTTVLDRLDDIDGRLRALEAASAATSSSPADVSGALHNVVAAPPVPPPPTPSPPPPSASLPQPRTPTVWPQIKAPRGPAAPNTAAGATTAPPSRTPVSSEAILKWVGVGLVVLAAVFFVSTAIQRGWIGPKLQFAIAVAGGLALLAVSEWFRSRRPRWSLAFAHGGITALGLVSAVGCDGLELYSSLVAAVLIAGVAAVSIAVAIHHGRASVAGTGVAVAILAPLIAGTPFHYDAHWSAAWLGGVIVVFTAVAVARQWVSLRATAFVLPVVPLLFAAFEIADADDGRAELLFGGVVAFVSIAAWLFGLVALQATRSPDPDSVFANFGAFTNLGAVIDERFLGIIPPLAWTLVALLNNYENDTALTFVAWGLAAAFAAVFIGLRRAGTIDERRSLAGIVGCSVLVTIGLVNLIDGPVLLVALTIQALGMGWLATRYEDIVLWLNAGLLGLIAGLWAFGGMVDAVEQGATVGEHLAYLLVVLAIAGLAIFTHRADADARFGGFSGPLAVVAFMGWMMWLLAALGELPQGQVAVSIAWAASGAAVLIAGLLARVGSFDARAVANVGLAALGVTVLKLVTVDLDAVDAIWRAGLFFIVGLGLLRLGLLIGSLDSADDEIERPAEHDERTDSGAPFGMSQTPPQPTG